MTPEQVNEALAKAMTERELEDSLAKMCKDLGIRRYHTHRAQHSPAGFPDDVMVGNRQVLYRELKRESKSPSAEQQAWLNDLEDAGHDVGVWRPSDLLSGRILRELLPLRHRPGYIAERVVRPEHEVRLTGDHL